MAELWLAYLNVDPPAPRSSPQITPPDYQIEQSVAPSLNAVYPTPRITTPDYSSCFAWYRNNGTSRIGGAMRQWNCTEHTPWSLEMSTGTASRLSHSYLGLEDNDIPLQRHDESYQINLTDCLSDVALHWYLEHFKRLRGAIQTRKKRLKDLLAIIVDKASPVHHYRAAPTAGLGPRPLKDIVPIQNLGSRGWPWWSKSGEEGKLQASRNEELASRVEDARQPSTLRSVATGRT